MFGKKTIKLSDGIVMTAEEVEELRATVGTLIDVGATKHEGVKDLQERLDAANAKLKDYGHLGAF